MDCDIVVIKQTQLPPLLTFYKFILIANRTYYTIRLTDIHKGKETKVKPTWVNRRTEERRQGVFRGRKVLFKYRIFFMCCTAFFFGLPLLFITYSFLSLSFVLFYLSIFLDFIFCFFGGI